MNGHQSKGLKALKLKANFRCFVFFQYQKLQEWGGRYTSFFSGVSGNSHLPYKFSRIYKAKGNSRSPLFFFSPQI